MGFNYYAFYCGEPHKTNDKYFAKYIRPRKCDVFVSKMKKNKEGYTQFN